MGVRQASGAAPPAADYSAANGKNTQEKPIFLVGRVESPVILQIQRDGLLCASTVQGHETRSHADLTDRDRDESSRRIYAWVRMDPQTQVRCGARTRAPISFARIGGIHARDMMTEGFKSIESTAAAEALANIALHPTHIGHGLFRTPVTVQFHRHRLRRQVAPSALLRQVAGGEPVARLKARLKAASES